MATQSSKACRFWSKGRCWHGNKCKYKHEGKGNCVEKPKEPVVEPNEPGEQNHCAMRATMPQGTVVNAG